MITDKELAEYQSLCGTLSALYGKLLERRQELRRLLEETAARRRDILIILAKANRLTRHLNGNQRHIAGLSYQLGEITALISGPAAYESAAAAAENPFEIGEMLVPSLNESRGKLKQMSLSVLALIDRVKKNLLQIDLLELRCRELIASINKSMEAFRHEYRLIHRKIYPFGIFSRFRRSLWSLAGRTYFSSRDMGDVAALGTITGMVLKIADSPLI
jgi:hypothetical protein